MTLKAALTSLLALALATPAIAASTVSPAAVLDSVAPAIPLVSCNTTAGSAVRVSPTMLITAMHVAVGDACTINGEPIKVIYSNKTLDYSILQSANPSPDYLRYSCGGFQADHLYVAVGHARGLDQVLEVPLMDTGHMDDGEAVLMGILTVQPGQSGGAMIDSITGKLVGIVNAADWENGLSYSTPLSSTSLCPIKVPAR